MPERDEHGKFLPKQPEELIFDHTNAQQRMMSKRGANGNCLLPSRGCAGLPIICSSPRPVSNAALTKHAVCSTPSSWCT
jgi:hypothetical protein